MDRRNRSWDTFAALFKADMDPHLSWSLVVLYLLCLLDILTTALVINRGGTEQNPLMVLVASSPVIHLLLKGLAVFLIFMLAIVAERRIRGSWLVIMGAAIGWFFVIVLHNAWVLVLVGP